MPKQASVKQYKLSPAEYQRILKGVDFNSISLVALEYHCDITQPVPDARLVLNKSASIKSQIEKLATVLFSFNLSGNIKEDSVMTVKGDYILLFSYSEEMSPEFFEIFQDTTLGNLVWPYLRELLSNLTARSNLPSLYLPLLKFIEN